MKQQVRKAGWLSKALLGGALALLSTSSAAAQGMGGGGGGGGGGSGSGLGGTTLGGLGGTSAGGSTPLSLGNARTGGTTGAAATPTANNPYTQYYSSALSPGLGPTRQLAPVTSSSTSASGTGGSTGGSSSSTSSTGFNSALNSTGAIATLKANSLSQPLFGTATTATSTSSSNQNLTGFSTVGVRRAPVYTTTIGFARAPRIAPTVLQAEIRQSLDRAPTLANGRGIKVAVNGTTVVMQGAVSSARERRVAEMLVRLTPGVRDVVNELQVPAVPAEE